MKRIEAMISIRWCLFVSLSINVLSVKLNQNFTLTNKTGLQTSYSAKLKTDTRALHYSSVTLLHSASEANWAKDGGLSITDPISQDTEITTFFTTPLPYTDNAMSITQESLTDMGTYLDIANTWNTDITPIVEDTSGTTSIISPTRFTMEATFKSSNVDMVIISTPTTMMTTMLTSENNETSPTVLEGFVTTTIVPGNASSVVNSASGCPTHCECRDELKIEKAINSTVHELKDISDETLRHLQKTRPDLWATVTIVLVIRHSKGLYDSTLESLKQKGLISPDMHRDMSCSIPTGSTLYLNEEISNELRQLNITTVSPIFNCHPGGNIEITSSYYFSAIEDLQVIHCNLSVNTQTINITKLSFFYSDKSLIHLPTQLVNIQYLLEMHFKNSNIVFFSNMISGISLPNLRRLSFEFMDSSTSNKDACISQHVGDSTSVPCCIVQDFTELRSLLYDESGLKIIPESCIYPPKLEMLSFSRNRITNLTAFEYPNSVLAPKLDVLVLSNNIITDLHIFAYLSVTRLLLDNNRIKSFQKFTFNRLPNVAEIDLSYNRITHIPNNAFKTLYFLRNLKLNNNLLVKIGNDHVPSLPSRVNLAGNRLQRLPFSSGKFQTTTAIELDIRGNDFICDCTINAFQTFVARNQNVAFYEREELNVVHLARRYGDESVIMYLFPHPTDVTCSWPEHWKQQPMLLAIVDRTCPVHDMCPKQCICEKQVVSNVTTISCSGKNIISFPSNLPPGKLHLDFSNNALVTLPPLHYLQRTISLNLSHNLVKNVSSAMCAMRNIQTLDLSYNKLQTLPDCFSNVKVNSLHGCSPNTGVHAANKCNKTSTNDDLDIYVHSNPWRCDCDLVWFQKKLLNHVDRNKIKCGNAQFRDVPVYSFAVSELGCEAFNYVVVAAPLSVLMLLLIVTIIILYRYRYESKVFLHATFKWRPFDRKRFEDPTKPFDAFVSYSSHDEDWIIQHLVPILENHKPPYRLCVHFRDFMVGEPIADNIVSAIENSKCTILVISEKFLESEWCLFEFQRAHFDSLQQTNARIIVVMKEEISKDKLPAELQQYITSNTYLDITDKWFWRKLYYALPEPVLQDVGKTELNK